MRLVILLALCATLMAGCAGNKSKPATDWSATSRNSAASYGPGTNRAAVIVTPGSVVSGRVSFVNPGSGFVVVTFPLGVMPAVDHRLNVYRKGLKVAELKVSKEQLDVNTVADIVTGECQAGDEARED